MALQHQFRLGDIPRRRRRRARLGHAGARSHERQRTAHAGIRCGDHRWNGQHFREHRGRSLDRPRHFRDDTLHSGRQRSLDVRADGGRADDTAARTFRRGRRLRVKRRRVMVLGSAIVVVLLAAAPVVAPRLGIDITVINEVLLDALAAMSVNLLLGYTGLPAFGNAAFFGLGAYGAALSIKYLDVGFVSAIAIGTATAFVGGLLIGPFLLRRRGIYFGLLAIAFGQVFYFIAYRFTNFTGGEDGMSISRPDFALFGPPHAINATVYYYVCLVVFVAIVAAFWVIAVSPFGQTLMAIRQNETRVRYLGLSSDRFIFVALMTAATAGGLGGSLYAMLINFAYPLLLDWHESGNFVLMTLLGGAGTVWGPLLGAVT